MIYGVDKRRRHGREKEGWKSVADAAKHGCARMCARVEGLQNSACVVVERLCGIHEQHYVALHFHVMEVQAYMSI